MNEVITWSDIESELNKGEQMGWQTVAQLAKVGQMLVAKMGDMTIREFVPHVGQHIPRLSKSTIHRYMMLAEHVRLLEQHKPDSQRAALALIQAANRPAPQPAPAPAPKPESAPVRMTDEQANAAIEAVKVEANLSKSAGARFDAAVKKAVNIAFKQMQENFEEDLEKERKAFNERLGPVRERLEAEEKAVEIQKEMWQQRNASPTTLLSEEEFKLIRGCLHSDRVPDDLKGRFDKAFIAVNKLSPWFEKESEIVARREKRSAAMKARWEAARKVKP